METNNSVIVYALIKRAENYEFNDSVETQVLGVSQDIEKVRELLKECAENFHQSLLVSVDESELQIENPNSDSYTIFETNNSYKWEYYIEPTRLY